MAPSASAAAGGSQSVITPTTTKKVPEKKYQCSFCSRAFSRSEHRSRHERSHTKERPFKCPKCRSCFVRRDLLLRHGRTVHAKDGDPMAAGQESTRKRSGPKTSPQPEDPTPEDFNTAPVPNVFANLQHTDDDEVHQTAALLNRMHKSALENGMNGNAMSPAQAVLADPADIDFDPHSLEWDLDPSIATMESHVDPQFLQDSESVNPALTAHAPFINPLTNQGDHLPQMFQHNPSLDMGLYNHHHPSPSPLPGTGMTPSDHLPTLGPVSPVDYRKSPSATQTMTHTQAPQVVSEEHREAIIENLRYRDPAGNLSQADHIPQLVMLNRQLALYFDLFHHHLPFLHPSTFSPTEVHPSLLLSILSIGALYIRDDTWAFKHHIGSKMLISQFLNSTEDFSSRTCPLWALQATLLNMVFASWSGDSKGVEWANSIKSLLANMVNGNRRELKLRVEARGGRLITHEEWILDEQCRRSYYSAFVFFGLQTLTYNYEPQIGISGLEALELPSSETIWTMAPSDEAAWRECMTGMRILTLREAYESLIGGETARYSAFATRIMINALFIQVWHYTRNPEALQDVVTEYKLRKALEQWRESLNECETETIIVRLPSTPDKGHPLIFNAKAMYRNTRARLTVDLKNVQEALCYQNAFEVAARMSEYKLLIPRSSQMIEVIEECYDCVHIPAESGVRWIARVGATSWSVEHPLCGLDLIVLLTIWLWRIDNDAEPPTDEERRMYQKVRTLFDNENVTQESGRSLSAMVARMWGNMIKTNVVWGINKTMGEAFLHYAVTLENESADGQEAILSNGHRDEYDELTHGPSQLKLEMQTAY